MTSKDLILNRLKEALNPLAVHELAVTGYSENNIATRLSEMQRVGIVKSRFRKGTHFKEWYIEIRPEPVFEPSGQAVMFKEGDGI